MCQIDNQITISKILMNDNQFIFKNGYTTKKYMLKISNDINNSYIRISIIADNINNNITHQKYLIFEDLEILDKNFFSPFKKDFNILYKFLCRLFIVKLARIKPLKSDDIMVTLICLESNKIKNIDIIIPKINNDMPKTSVNNINSMNTIYDIYKVNKDYSEAPIPLKNNNNNNIIYFNPFKKKNGYKIELYKIERYIEGSTIYKEIEIKISDFNENKEYSCYLNIFDFLNLSYSYYNLFNYSIDDIYDDLIIIISNKNINIEIIKNKIKFFFQVFNLGEFTNCEPYFNIYLVLDAKITEKKDSDFKIENINSNQSLKFRIINSEIKEINDIGDTQAKKNINIEEKLDEISKNIENSEKTIKKEVKINKKIAFSQNYNENSYLSNKYFNNLLKSKEKIEKDNNEDDYLSTNIYNNNFLLGHKRISYKDTNLFSFFKKESNLKSDILTKKETNSDNNIKIDKLEKIMNSIKENKVNHIKKDDNYDNIFNLDKYLRYNIKKEEIRKKYENRFFRHPLDKDDEYKILYSSDNKEYYLCKICNKCFKNRNNVREHQWRKPRKPYSELMIKELNK